MIRRADEAVVHSLRNVQHEARVDVGGVRSHEGATASSEEVEVEHDYVVGLRRGTRRSLLGHGYLDDARAGPFKAEDPIKPSLNAEGHRLRWRIYEEAFSKQVANNKEPDFAGLGSVLSEFALLAAKRC
jgi:hypothetical protein